jgi:hypothetical protein
MPMAPSGQAAVIGRDLLVGPNPSLALCDPLPAWRPMGSAAFPRRASAALWLRWSGPSAPVLGSLKIAQRRSRKGRAWRAPPDGKRLSGHSREGIGLAPFPPQLAVTRLLDNGELLAGTFACAG